MGALLYSRYGVASIYLIHTDGGLYKCYWHCRFIQVHLKMGHCCHLVCQPLFSAIFCLSVSVTRFNIYLFIFFHRITTVLLYSFTLLLQRVCTAHDEQRSTLYKILYYYYYYLFSFQLNGSACVHVMA